MADLGAGLRIEPASHGYSLTGEIDAHTAPRLQSAVDDHFAEGASVLELAMHEVTFMDSSGLRVVLAATDTARGRGGDVVLLAPTASVRRLVEVTGLTGHLTVESADPGA